MPDLRILALIGLSLVLALTYGYVSLVEQPRPVLDASLELQGLTDSVEIIRDEHAIPHIYTQNEQDLFFAQGFVHAQDRLWQMEINRHVGQGRLAELFGEAALQTDIAVRTLGVHKAIDDYTAMLSDVSTARLDAYVAGINAYINSEIYRVPTEFKIIGHTAKPWEPQDVFGILAAMAINLQSHYGTIYERARAQAELPPELFASINQPYNINGSFVVNETGQGVIAEDSGQLQLLGASPNHSTNERLLKGLKAFDAKFDFLRELGLIGADFGSNNWAVHGSRTATGMPFLANDPHLSPSQPATWYENHLNAPDWHVTGATLAGIPGVIIGHNEHIAWGVTVSYLAMQDLFIEQIDPEDPSRYRYEDEWRNAEVITEQIHIKGQEEPVEHEIIVTHHGPLITELLESDEQLALAWVFTQPPDVDSIAAVLNINQAHNWGEFRNAVSNWVFDLNFVYADTAGNIGYQMSGRLPERGSNYRGIPVAGWTGEHEWSGLRDYDTLPHVLNPGTGFVATANSRVISDALYDEIAAEWGTPFRTIRISSLLQKRERFTLEDMRRFQADSYAEMYLHLRQLLVELFEPQNRFERSAMEQIEGWHGVVHRESVGPVILDQLARELLDVVYRRHLPEDSRYIHILNGMYYFWEMARTTPNSDWYDNPETPDREDLRAVLRESFQNALDELTKEHGPDISRWTWSNARPVIFEHALGGLPLIGSLFNTLSSTAGGRFTLNRETTSYRFIADLSNWSNSRSAITTGQSGHPFSDYYADQIEDWRNVQPRRMPWTREEVVAIQSHTLILAPAQ